MSILELFFDKRKKEVNSYFRLLEQLKIDENTSYYINARTSTEELHISVDEQQIKILKSNCFLLIYNCIEGTVNKSIEVIIDSINDNAPSLKNKDVIKEIKEIWFKSNLHANDIDYEQYMDIAEHIEIFINEKINIDLNKFKDKNKKYFVTGNLNDEKICDEVLPKIGIHDMNDRESKLEDIRKIRNNLAHGRESFVDIGASNTLLEIQEYKGKIFRFLEKYIIKVDAFIYNKDYKIS